MAKLKPQGRCGRQGGLTEPGLEAREALDISFAMRGRKDSETAVDMRRRLEIQVRRPKMVTRFVKYVKTCKLSMSYNRLVRRERTKRTFLESSETFMYARRQNMEQRPSE